MKTPWPPLSMPDRPQATAWLDERVVALRTSMVNAYLVRGDEGLIAIDSGFRAVALAKELAELRLEGADVMAVFLTHGDSDHVGGLDALPNATVFLGADEEQMVTGQTRRFLIGNEPRLNRPHELLEDGQVVNVAGCQVRAIATPGHTPGSTSYLVDGRYLFIGDTCSLRAGWLAPFSRLVTMDPATQRESIRKLAQLHDIALVCTGHSGASRDWERVAEPWRQR